MTPLLPPEETAEVSKFGNHCPWLLTLDDQALSRQENQKDIRHGFSFLQSRSWQLPPTSQTWPVFINKKFYWHAAMPMSLLTISVGFLPPARAELRSWDTDHAA